MTREVTNAAHVAGAQVKLPGYRLMPQTMRPDFAGKSGLEMWPRGQEGGARSECPIRSVRKGNISRLSHAEHKPDASPQNR
jgi:hypothetical protein